MTDLTEGTEADEFAGHDEWEVAEFRGMADVDRIRWSLTQTWSDVEPAGYPPYPLKALERALHQAYEDGLVDGDRNAQAISENYDRNHALWATKLTEAQATIERLRGENRLLRGALADQHNYHKWFLELRDTKVPQLEATIERLRAALLEVRAMTFEPPNEMSRVIDAAFNEGNPE